MLFLFYLYTMMQSEEFIQVKKHIESFDYQVVDFDFELLHLLFDVLVDMPLLF